VWKKILRKRRGKMTEETRKLLEAARAQTLWIIWVCKYDPFGRVMGALTLPQHYKHKSSAVRRAKQLYGGKPNYEWVVKPVHFVPVREKGENGEI
jgi:hypothetical protein